MKRIVLILLAFLSFTAQAQFVVFTIGGGPSTQGAADDSTLYDNYYATVTFKLGSTGVVIAEIDTSSVATLTDTIRFYITGSAQPTADTVLNASIDTSFKVGSGVTWDSITYSLGEVRWYSGGVGKDISEVIYTTPDAPTTLTISSPDSDTLTYAVSIFGSPANGTVSDSCLVLWDTIAIPTISTDGNEVYRGDTTIAETDFFIDMDDSLKVYITALAKNDGTLGTGTWSVAKTDSVFIDSTGAAYETEYAAVRDKMIALGYTPADSIATKQNIMVRSLVDSSIWSTKDGLWLPANGNVLVANINWIAPTSADTLDPVSAPTWTAWEGYTFDGVADYIDYGLGNMTGLSNYALNSANIAAYFRSFTFEDPATYAFGNYDGSDGITYFKVSLVGGSFYYTGAYINSNAGFSEPSSNTAGWMCIGRTASDAFYRLHNSDLDAAVNASGSVPAMRLIFGAVDNGSASYFSAGQISYMSVGSGLSSGDSGVERDIVEIYMDSNGKGVL